MLHILIDDYIMFWRAHMENLQERMYKSKINMLIKQGGLQIFRNIFPHYSNPAIGMHVMVHNVMGHTQAFSMC